MARIARLLVGVSAVCLLSTMALADEGFDRPLARSTLRTTMPPTAWPRSDTPVPVTITCLRYAGVLVKTMVGDAGWPNQTAVVPGADRLCRVRYPDERIIGWGTFQGIKNGLFFFANGSHGDHGEQSFEVLGRSGRTVLIGDRIGQFQSLRSEAGVIVLRYRRTANFGCSLYYGTSTACWSTIKAETGLDDAAAPACRDAYEALVRTYKEKQWPGENRVWEHAVVIAYNAEARIDGRTIRFTARPGSTECWPAY